MADELIDLDDSPRSASLWNEIVDASPEAWFWATRAMHEYRVEYYKSTGRFIADRSFALIRDGRPRGLAPLVLGHEPHAGDIVASHMDAPLPWPMAAPGADDPQELREALFDELEQRVRDAGAGLLRLSLAPPGVGADFANPFAKVVRDRSFIDISHVSHCAEINSDSLSRIRGSYRRDVNKSFPNYGLDILSKDNTPDWVARTYMELHIKDAGRVTRPLSTFERQIDLIRQGEGFIVSARNTASDRIVGMLIVSLHKAAAYYNSVAVDPDFERDHVSHMMQWTVFQHLIALGVPHYELGMAAIAPSYLWQPTKKNYGISFYKDGWSRGRTKTIWQAEKFYSRGVLERFWARKKEDLCQHFGL